MRRPPAAGPLPVSLSNPNPAPPSRTPTLTLPLPTPQRSLFPASSRIFCSRKPLREDEFRTAYVSFASIEMAAAELERLDGFTLDGFGLESQRPISVAFSTKEQDQQPRAVAPGYGPAHHQMRYEEHAVYAQGYRW